MKVLLVLLVAAFVSYTLADDDYSDAFQGYLEDEPGFQKRFPNIPGPIDHIDPHIVGGVEAIPNSLPYQVGIYIEVSGGRAFCGGSLINARTIVTAAHCVDTRTGNITAHLGTHNMPPNVNDTFAVSVNITNVIIHPGWNRSILLHDIALLHLGVAIPLSVNIRPIQIPRDGSHDYLGNTTLVSGWGRPSETIFTISPVLREVTTFIISNYACRLAYLGTVQESHICTSGGLYRGTCNGDSGGPLTVNGILIGVVSFGSSWGCAQGWPAAYARVTNYREWILANQALV